MVAIGDVPRLDADSDLWAGLEALDRSGLDALLVTTGAADSVLMTRRSAARLVHDRAEARQRQLIALGQIRKGRFRGR
jgi:hypothetical protein